jgi:hypothetical protein
MNRMILDSRVGADGVLQLMVPLGAAEADRDVRVTIEPVAPAHGAPDDYAAWLHSVAGKWQGDFERPPQGVLEEREPLS